MPDFIITAPDGKKYKVSGPDAAGAVAALKKMLGKGPGLKSAIGAAATVAPSAGEDVAKAAASGLVTGTEAGLGIGGDLATGGIKLADLAKRKLFGGAPLSPDAIKNIRSSMPIIGTMPSSAEVGNVVSGVTGFQPYEAQTTPGKSAGTAAEFVPSAFAFGLPGGLKAAFTSALKFGVLPGLASEATGQIAASMPATAPYESAARFVGAIAAPGMASLARRAVTPFPAPAARTAAARTLAKEGVDLTPGQRTGSRMLRVAETELAGGRSDAIAETQGRQFTAAVLKRAGINADAATPEVIDGAFQRIGAEFDRIVKGKTFRLDNADYQKVIDALDTYASTTAPSMRIGLVTKIADDITAPNVVLNGDMYSNTRSLLGKQIRALQISNPPAAEALRDIQSILDSAMQKNLKSIVDIRDLQTARRQYKNLMTIESAATGSGEAAGQGIITPARLRAATVASAGKRNYVRGRTEFDRLGRAGMVTMTPPANSNTAARLSVRSVPAAAGALFGAAATGGDIGSGVLGALAGTAVPPLVGRAMLSRRGATYLANQRFLPPPKLTAAQKAALSILYARPLIAGRESDLASVFGATTGGAGAVMGAPFGPVGSGIGAIAAPAAGVAAKSGANALTSRALSLADEAVRMRSPLYRAQTPNMPSPGLEAMRRAALWRALIQTASP